MLPALMVIPSQKLQTTVALICQHIRAKDPSTFTHSLRVEKLSARLAAIVSTDPVFIAKVRIASLVHDVGKVAISASILSKHGQLTPSEYSLIRAHPQIGYEYLRAFSQLSDIARITLYHHEWYSGQGYPMHLFGERIPLESRIICLTDAFEAMIGNRTYKTPISITAALDELGLCSGSQFDPTLVSAFVEDFGKGNGMELLQKAEG